MTEIVIMTAKVEDAQVICKNGDKCAGEVFWFSDDKKRSGQYFWPKNQKCLTCPHFPGIEVKPLEERDMPDFQKGRLHWQQSAYPSLEAAFEQRILPGLLDFLGFRYEVPADQVLLSFTVKGVPPGMDSAGETLSCGFHPNYGKSVLLSPGRLGVYESQGGFWVVKNQDGTGVGKIITSDISHEVPKEVSPGRCLARVQEITGGDERRIKKAMSMALDFLWEARTLKKNRWKRSVKKTSFLELDLAVRMTQEAAQGMARPTLDIYSHQAGVDIVFGGLNQETKSQLEELELAALVLASWMEHIFNIS